MATKSNYKYRITNELVKFNKGYDIKFTNMEEATLKDFEMALSDSKLPFDNEQIQKISLQFLLAKYYG